MLARKRNSNVEIARIVRVFSLGSLRTNIQDGTRYPTSDTAHSVQELEQLMSDGWIVETMTANEKQLFCIMGKER